MSQTVCWALSTRDATGDKIVYLSLSRSLHGVGAGQAMCEYTKNMLSAC